MGKQGRERTEHSFTEKSEEGISFNKRTPLKTKYQIPPLEFISIYFFFNISRQGFSVIGGMHHLAPFIIF